MMLWIIYQKDYSYVMFILCMNLPCVPCEGTFASPDGFGEFDLSFL